MVQCSKCTRQFKNGRALRMHDRVHTGRCKGCGEQHSRQVGELIIPNYCQTCSTVKVHAGLTRAELSEAFELVKPHGNWKNPIDRILFPAPQGHEIQAIHYAIEFYSGGGAKFQYLESGTKVRVTAPGYYVLIGA